MMNEALQGMTAVRSLVEPKLDAFAGRDPGAIADRLGIEKLPGFRVTEQGGFTHDWAENGVTFANLGNAVVRFSLDGVGASHCVKLSSRLFSAAVTPGYRSYLMIDNNIFEGAASPGISEISALCADGANVGLIFARSAKDVRDLDDFESVPVDPEPETNPTPVIPDPGDVPPDPGDELDTDLPETTAPGTPDPVPVPPAPVEPVVEAWLGPDTWPGGWGQSPYWNGDVTSNWIPTGGTSVLQGNQMVKIWGDGNPTIQMADNTRGTEGMLSPWGTNIHMDVPKCGTTSKVYIQLENGKTYGYQLTRPEFTDTNAPRPANCD